MSKHPKNIFEAAYEAYTAGTFDVSEITPLEAIDLIVASSGVSPTDAEQRDYGKFLKLLMVARDSGNRNRD
jgi:hypothetical protein